jgi:hypothetical protein
MTTTGRDRHELRFKILSPLHCTLLLNDKMMRFPTYTYALNINTRPVLFHPCTSRLLSAFKCLRAEVFAQKAREVSPRRGNDRYAMRGENSREFSARKSLYGGGSLPLFFILGRLGPVINRSYDAGIKDSPASPEESHDVLPPPCDGSERGTCRAGGGGAGGGGDGEAGEAGGGESGG